MTVFKIFSVPDKYSDKWDIYMIAIYVQSPNYCPCNKSKNLKNHYNMHITWKDTSLRTVNKSN